MANHLAGRFSSSLTRQQNRQTIWPTADPGTLDIQISAPWLSQYDSAPNKRWTGAFDTEARASHMSFLADNTLLPRAPNPNNQHERWAGKRSRHTWLNPVDAAGSPEKVWSGEFDVERRPSWVGRDSGASDGATDEKLSKMQDELLVHWKEGDVENPMNFSNGRKWANAMVLAFSCFMVSIASSGFSQGTIIFPKSRNLGYSHTNRNKGLEDRV